MYYSLSNIIKWEKIPHRRSRIFRVKEQNTNPSKEVHTILFLFSLYHISSGWLWWLVFQINMRKSSSAGCVHITTFPCIRPPIAISLIFDSFHGFFFLPLRGLCGRRRNPNNPMQSPPATCPAFNVYLVVADQRVGGQEYLHVIFLSHSNVYFAFFSS